VSVARVKVGELAEQVRGVSYGKGDASDSPQTGYLPVLRAGNITDDGLVFDDLVFVPKGRVSEKQKVRHHDVVVAASSGSLDVVGKAAPALADFDGGFGAFCKVLRPNAKVHAGYFAHFFKTLDYRRRVSALAAGANINNLRNEHLDDMEIPLPPLAEQRRIAEVLDRAEALRAKRRAALAQLDSLTQSLFLDLFGDPVSNPRKWPQENLEAVFHFRTGKLDSNAAVASGQYPFFTCSREDYLLPTVNYPPKLEKIVSGLLAEINATQPIMPDGSGRRLRLHLGEKTGLQVAIVS
jgi:type I restriction enzyme S subunit